MLLVRQDAELTSKSGAGVRFFRLAMRAEEINELIAANVVTQLSDVTGIPLSLIVIGIINRVHEMQMAHANVEKNI